jgi:hypothetical protein
METRLRPGHPVLADDDELRDLQALVHVLAIEGGCRPTITAPDGGTLPLPRILTTLLRDITQVLAAGGAVDVAAVPHVLTVVQSAIFLDESEADVEALIRDGRLPTTGETEPVRIRLVDAMSYKEQRDAERRLALEELIQLNQDLGLYSLP